MFIIDKEAVTFLIQGAFFNESFIFSPLHYTVKLFELSTPSRSAGDAILRVIEGYVAAAVVTHRFNYTRENSDFKTEPE